MKTQLVVLAAIFTAAITQADPYVIAKQRARGVVDQNNAEQARIQRGAADTQAADPALQATMQNITDLAADFTAFGKAEKADATQKASLMNNLTLAAKGKKANSDSVKKLAADLSTALTGNKKITAAQSKQLGGYVHAVFNGSHVTEAQLEKITVASEKILTTTGVPAEATADVIADLKKIAAETK